MGFIFIDKICVQKPIYNAGYTNKKHYDKLTQRIPAAMSSKKGIAIVGKHRKAKFLHHGDAKI
jgi:hypothetical protein